MYQNCTAVDSDCISLWLAEGTNYPGQDSLRLRRGRLLESLQEIYAELPAGMRLLLEYKFFEPAFYSTDLPDWGTSLLMAQTLGPQAEVLVDTGHHPQGTNIPQIVAQLLAEGRLGGFHFNDRKYADDDLIVGSQSPFELFCIFNEIVDAKAFGIDNASRIDYMIDQSHNIEPKIEAMIQSVYNIQIAYAKALMVDRAREKETPS
jgi:L-rhamnose isomerase/sugar isomerase